MRNRLAVLILIAAAGATAYPRATFAQSAKPGEAKAHAASAMPDLTGVWRRSRSAPDKTRKYTIYELAFTISNDVPPMTP